MSCLAPSPTNGCPGRALFLQWEDRALLSPLPTGSWGGGEHKLAERFVLLPATPIGLGAAIEEFGREEASHWESYLSDISDAIREPVYFRDSLLHTLEYYFPDRLLRLWIAACAFYPSLHWELTLHLGSLIQKQYGRAGLISMENLLELTRLPWFIEGRIPDLTRDELLHWLEVSGEESTLRTLLLRSLSQAPAPPDGSAAYADYRMQLVFNQWMLEQDPELKTKMEAEFAQFLKAGLTPEFVVFKRLDRALRRSDFVVPPEWLKYIHIDVDPVHGDPPPDTPDELDIRSPKGDQLGRMVSVKGGTFTMGWKKERDGEGYDDENRLMK
ncbi:MAG: hypothetical protein IPK21_06720 [Haliscomenobacter sp.]|nr:hypothetical protein [Haliscomenobacter sp.]